MKLTNSLLLTVCCLLFTTTNLLADDCRIETPSEGLNRAIVVFSGRVTALNRAEVSDPTNNNRTTIGTRVSFQVSKWWKGNGAKDASVSIRKYFPPDTTTRSGSDFMFEKDAEYLVYASGEQLALTTDSCTRTKKLADAATDLAALGEGVTPKPPSECPQINIINHNPEVSKGTWVVEATVKNIDPKIKLTYNWRYSVSRKFEKKYGQSSPMLTIENIDTQIGVDIFILIDGIPMGCENGMGIFTIV